MNGIKANWHVALSDVPEADPFGERPLVERVGRPIELDDAPRLMARLDATLDREGKLYEKGVECAIKTDPQASCSACPLRHLDPLDSLAPLCALGLEQESLITRLRILEIERHARQEPTG